MEHLDRQLKVTASSMLSQLNSGCNRSRFNVMTVGPCCIGKTMFLESLLKDYVSDDVNNHKSPRTNISESPGLEWQGDETDKLQVMEVGQARLSSVDLVIYDSNGYGDIVNNQEAIDVIRSHLMLAHANWRKLDVQVLVNRSKDIEFTIYWLIFNSTYLLSLFSTHSSSV